MNNIQSQLRKAEQQSTLIWLVNNVKLPKGMEWDFTDRRWQLDIIEDQSSNIVMRKPTQIGASIMMLGKMLHFADTYQCRAMYTLPRQDDVYDMVNSRLEEMLAESPYLQDKIGSGVDNVRIKRFGQSYLHFSEMSVMPRMNDVDWLCNDEVDLSNPEYLEQVTARLDASKFGVHHRISTPTIHNFGIDNYYQLSDKKEWFVTCPYCSHEQIMDWETNVVNHKGVTKYVCAKCHNPLMPDDIRDGRWIATGAENSPISGYQISQLMVPYITADRLWVQYKTMTTRNFYNYRLGIPYTPTTGNITKEGLYETSFRTQHNHESLGDGYVIGVDQGNNLYIVVGKFENDVLKIVHIEESPFPHGFNRLAELMSRYNAKQVVLDAMPNRHSSYTFANMFNRGRVLTAYFVMINELYTVKENVININKTDAYDALKDAIDKGMIQFYGRPNEFLETSTAVTHLANMRRDAVRQKSQLGGEKVSNIWVATGPDHFADAILYMYMAHDVSSNLTNFRIGNIRPRPAYIPEFGRDKPYQVTERQTLMDEEGFSMELNPYVRKNQRTMLRRKKKNEEFAV